MKTMMLAAAMATLAIAANPAAVVAAEAGAGKGSAMAQTTERQSSDRSMNSRYVWQYHYGRKAQFEGQWVLAR